MTTHNVPNVFTHVLNDVPHILVLFPHVFTTEASLLGSFLAFSFFFKNIYLFLNDWSIEMAHCKISK